MCIYYTKSFANVSITKQHCSPEDASIGKWVSTDTTPVQNIVEWIYSSKHYNSCNNKWGEFNNGSRPMWEWEPDGCTLQYFSKEGLCNKMKNKKGILFIGDSITAVFYYTMLFSTDSSCEYSPNNVVANCHICDDKKISFIFNAFLDTREDIPGNECPERSHDGMTKCGSFFKEETLKQYDILVINRGLHYTEPVEYYREMSETASKISTMMTDLHDDPILIWRNSVPGHVGCEDKTFGEPISSIEEAEHGIISGGKIYNWYMIQYENILIEPVMRDNGFDILDVYSSTILRSDSHIDCLHYCIPGPVDHWIRLLYNMI